MRTYRVMIVDECGTEQCIHNNVAEWDVADKVGEVKEQYIEARSVFAEKERTFFNNE